MKILNNLLGGFVLLIVGLASLSIFVPGYAFADIDDNTKKACEAIGGCGAEETANTEASNLIDNVVNIVAFITGAVSVLMIVIGGFRYVISNGDPQGTQNAKNTILYALVGLVLAFTARGLILFVVGRL